MVRGTKDAGKRTVGGLHLQGTRSTVGKKNSKSEKANIDRKKKPVHSSRDEVCNSDPDVKRTIVLPILKCVYTNADQLLNKIPELIVRARDIKPHIMGITEVNPKNSRYNPGIAEYSLNEI